MIILTRKLEQQVRMLIKYMSDLISNFAYRQGPALYFYRKTIKLRRTKPLIELFRQEDDRYLELIYATLASWDMNSRRARMKYFSEFKSSILNNEENFIHLSSLVLDNLSEGEFSEAKEACREIYENLDVMKSYEKLTSNSKIMHFILPDLVMPMDGKNTLNFFFGNKSKSLPKFLTILECSYYVARRLNLKQFLDKEWNLSTPKVIDNAIISYMSPKYNIHKFSWKNK